MTWRRNNTVNIDSEKLAELVEALSKATKALEKSCESALTAASALKKATDRAAEERRRPIIRNR